jgi:cytochrome c-type biogenesis protein CcmH
MARRLIEGTLALDPTDVRARFFLGLAQAQDDQARQALQTWLALEAAAPADAAWLDGLRANIDRLTASAGIDAPTLAALRQAAGTP